MDVQIGGRSEALDQRDGAGGGFGALESRLLDQKCRNDPVDDLQDGREQVRMCSEETTKRDRKREHSLAHRHPRDDVIDQVGGGFCHAPGAASGQKPRRLQEKATSFSWPQSAAAQAQKTVGWFILRLLAMWVAHWVKKTLLFGTSG